MSSKTLESIRREPFNSVPCFKYIYNALNLDDPDQCERFSEQYISMYRSLGADYADITTSLTLLPMRSVSTSVWKNAILKCDGTEYGDAGILHEKLTDKGLSAESCKSYFAEMTGHDCPFGSQCVCCENEYCKNEAHLNNERVLLNFLMSSTSEDFAKAIEILSPIASSVFRSASDIYRDDSATSPFICCIGLHIFNGLCKYRTSDFDPDDPAFHDRLTDYILDRINSSGVPFDETTTPFRRPPKLYLKAVVEKEMRLIRKTDCNLISSAQFRDILNDLLSKDDYAASENHFDPENHFVSWTTAPLITADDHGDKTDMKDKSDSTANVPSVSTSADTESPSVKGSDTDGETVKDKPKKKKSSSRKRKVVSVAEKTPGQMSLNDLLYNMSGYSAEETKAAVAVPVPPSTSENEVSETALVVIGSANETSLSTTEEMASCDDVPLIEESKTILLLESSDDTEAPVSETDESDPCVPSETDADPVMNVPEDLESDTFVPEEANIDPTINEPEDSREDVEEPAEEQKNDASDDMDLIKEKALPLSVPENLLLFNDSVLHDKLLSCEVFFSVSSKPVMLFYTRCNKQFFYSMLATAAERDMISMYLRHNSIPKVCYQPFGIYSLCKMMHGSVRNVYSLECIDHVLNETDAISSLPSVIENLTGYKKELEEESPVIFAFNFMPVYRNALRSGMRNIRSTGKENILEEQHDYWKALGFDQYRHSGGDILRIFSVEDDRRPVYISHEDISSFVGDSYQTVSYDIIFDKPNAKETDTIVRKTLANLSRHGFSLKYDFLISGITSSGFQIMVSSEDLPILDTIITDFIEGISPAVTNSKIQLKSSVSGTI